MLQHVVISTNNVIRATEPPKGVVVAKVSKFPNVFEAINITYSLVKTLSSEMNSIKSSIQTINSDITNLKSQISTINSEIANIKEQIEELKPKQ